MHSKHCCAFLLALNACSSQEDFSPAVANSAGVQTVTYPDSARPPATWQIDPQPLLQLGDQTHGPNEEFTQIVGAVHLDDGGVVVGNSGTSELRFFSAAGIYLGKAGSKGEGPGEFTQLMKVMRVGDTVIGTNGTGSAAKFSLDRKLLGVIAPASTIIPRASSMEGYFSDGSTVYNETHRIPDLPEAGGLTYQISMHKISNGGMVSTLLDHVTATTLVGSPVGPRGRVFDGGLHWSFSPSGFCTIPAATFTISCFDASGKPTSVTIWQRNPAVVTEAMKAEFLNELATHPARSESGDIVIPPPGRPKLETIFADVLPFVIRMHQTRENELWVQSYSPQIAILAARRLSAPIEPTDWTVFDAGGRMLAAVQLPAGFRPYEMGHDYVLGLTRDADDVEMITMYRVRRE